MLQHFVQIAGSEKPIDLDLPNQWLYDIIDEFIYQVSIFFYYKFITIQIYITNIAFFKDHFTDK